MNATITVTKHGAIVVKDEHGERMRLYDLHRLNRQHAGNAGRVTCTRGVQGSEPCFAGTRIPVRTLWSYLDAKISERLILKDYPTLLPEDVALARRLLRHARQYERDRRRG